MDRAKRYVVRGRVQGVGYRYYASREAARLGVTGFARNLPNGDVEVHAEAGSETLQLFRQQLERGPRMAYVTEVLESEIPVTGLYSSFLIKG